MIVREVSTKRQFTVRRVSTSANPLRTYWLSLNFVSLTSKSRTSLLNPPLGFAYLYA